MSVPSHHLTEPAPPGGRGRHERPGSSLAQLGLVAGVILVIVLLGWWGLSGSGSPPAGPVVLPIQPNPTISIPPASEEPSPTPSATPEATPTARSRPDVGRLLASLETTVRQLTNDRQVDRNAGKELSRRVNEIQQAHSAGNVGRTWETLEEFARRVLELHRESRISAPAYNTLVARINELTRALPPRS